MDTVRRTARASSGRGAFLATLDADLRVIALAVVAGASAVYYLPVLLPLALFACLLALCLLRFPGRAVLAAVIISAAWTTYLAQAQMAQRLPAAADGSVRWVHGYVDGLVEKGDFRSRFAFVSDGPVRRMRLSWYEGAPALAPGDCFELQVKLSAPHGSANPGGFDYEAWLWREGIGATGYVKQARACGAADGWSIDRMRAGALAHTKAALGDHPMRGVVEALTIGVRHAITDRQWEVFRVTGTSHLVAISGLHIGLVAGWLFFVARWTALRLPWRAPALTVASLVAFTGALFYALLAGLALPTQRALVMVGVGLAALWAARALDAGRLLALAAILVVAWHPVSVLSPGFWLSFGAVAWITYLVVFRPRGRGALFVWLQFGLAAGLMPITLYAFGQASVVSPLANAVLIPLASVFVPLVLLSTLATLAWPPLGAPLLRFCADLLAALWPILERVAEWPLAAFHLAAPGLFTVALAIAGIALLLAPRGLPGRWLGALLVLPLIIGWQAPDRGLSDGGYRLALLDVGQGLSAVVHTSQHTLVYDAGPAYRTGFNAGGAIVAPYLRHVGVSVLDLMVISHPDMDHLGGAGAIADLFSVERRLGAGSATPCRAGQAWRWDGVDFEILHPAAVASRDQGRNDASCVLRITGPGGSVLLPGDIEASAEQMLVARQGDALEVDVAVVRHHGSDSSSTAEFVAASAPAHALIASGWNNRWGFPDAAVVARYRAQGARVFNTANAGAIFLDVRPAKPIEVTRWRYARRRFWQVPLPE